MVENEWVVRSGRVQSKNPRITVHPYDTELSEWRQIFNKSIKRIAALLAALIAEHDEKRLDLDPNYGGAMTIFDKAAGETLAVYTRLMAELWHIPPPEMDEPPQAKQEIIDILTHHFGPHVEAADVCRCLLEEPDWTCLRCFRIAQKASQK